ncbi:hypothetical protein [Mitsuokella sp.]|uniref:hypothetical protein n=1 Tax=unclassified Mitsuokella TaxID=2637239 RepID=UPI003D7D8B8A
MKLWRKGVVWLLAALLLWCFSSIAMASSYDTTASILSKLQGQWYDAEGNVVLDFQGRTVNGCEIVGAYHPAGGNSDFSCIIRIVEADGYRDLPLICESLRKDSYHSHVILNKDNMDDSKGTMLMRMPQARYYESVGGIGLDMPAAEVVAKYGRPDKIQKSKTWKTLDTWQYQKLGLELTMRHQRVFIIKMYRNGNRHFDRTGFNCANAPYEFQEAYGFRQAPKAGQYGAYSVGHGEYMWFDDYPNSITLSMFWN